MKFEIVRLLQSTFLGSRAWRYASPEPHYGEMSLSPYILNDTQGYRPSLMTECAMPLALLRSSTSYSSV